MVLSPADGVVVFAGRVVNRSVVTIDHGNGLRSSFESIDPLVGNGTLLAKGGEVGTVAHSPGLHCSGNCLHWGVRLGRDYVNPLDYVTDRRPSVLLPVRREAPG